MPNAAHHATMPGVSLRDLAANLHSPPSDRAGAGVMPVARRRWRAVGPGAVGGGAAGGAVERLQADRQHHAQPASERRSRASGKICRTPLAGVIGILLRLPGHLDRAARVDDVPADGLRARPEPRLRLRQLRLPVPAAARRPVNFIYEEFHGHPLTESSANRRVEIIFADVQGKEENLRESARYRPACFVSDGSHRREM